MGNCKLKAYLQIVSCYICSSSFARLIHWTMGDSKEGSRQGRTGGEGGLKAYTTLQLVNRWYFGVLKLYVQSFSAQKMQFNL